MTALVKISFNDFAVEQTGFNSAVSYVLKNAVAGAYPVFSIQYVDVLVSRGDLPNVLAPSAKMEAGSQLTFTGRTTAA